jgi:hypothetical protein
MTQTELKTLTQNALQQAYCSQVMTLYSVLASKIITARGTSETNEAVLQFQKGLQLAKETLAVATKGS